MPRRLLTPLLCVPLAFPAHLVLGQASDFQSALSGAKYPLTLTMKDLDSNWRSVSISVPAAPNSAPPQSSVLAGPDQPARYLTKGQTVTVGSETFLVAYLVPVLNFVLPYLNQRTNIGEAAARAAAHDQERTFKLSLLNVRQIGSLDSVVAFVPQTAEEARVQAKNASNEASQNSLLQLGLALNQYMEDNDEKLPPMQAALITKNVLFAFVKDSVVFQQPLTHEPYQPNSALSGRLLATFKRPTEMVVYYEISPTPDGTRAVLFLDGHVKRVGMAEWQRLKVASHVPNPR